MLKSLISRRTAPVTTKYQTITPSIRFFCNTTRPLPQNGIQHIPLTQFLRSRIHAQIRCSSHSPIARFRHRYQEAKKDIWQTHPILFPSMILFVLTTVGTGFYFVYDYVYNVQPRLDRYPTPVSNALRKAIYYTEIDLDPTKALAWYKQALSLADRLEMHPFSDEVLGIRFQIAAMLERAGLVKAAIDVLEKARADSEEWVTNGRRRKRIQEAERTVKNQEERQTSVDPEAGQHETDAKEAEAKEDKLRDEVMKKVQGTWLKLAELYGGDYIRDMAKTENALIQAVSVSRTELQRRKDLNLPTSKEDGNNFVNLTHVATAYNELADFYVKKGKSNLATTLYMQALSLIKQDQEPGSATCAQVVLLNNISSQMAEQAQAPVLPTQNSGGPPLSHGQLLDAASEWAKKALDVAAHIKPPIRDEECDSGCLVATYNLGEIAEMQENFVEAKKLYQTAKELATQLQSGEAVQKVDEALKRLEGQK